MEANFTHFAISVSDMQKSLHFYCDGLGFEASERETTIPAVPANSKTGTRAFPEFRMRFIRRNGIQVELVHTEEEQRSAANEPSKALNAFPRGFSHLAIKVGDVMGMAKRLEEFGGTVDWDARIEFPLKGGGKCTALFLTDPDGVRVELNDVPPTKRFPD